MGGFATKPDEACYADAKRYHLKPPLHLVNTPYYLQHCLGIFRFPIVTGFSVPAAFMEDNGPMEKTGHMPLADWLKGNFQGGHCVAIVGYTATDYIITNSWGTDWGDRGHFYVPKRLIEAGTDCIFDDFRMFPGLTIAEKGPSCC